MAEDYTPTPEAVGVATDALLSTRLPSGEGVPLSGVELETLATVALTAAGPLIAADALEGQQGVYGESPAAGDVMMPPETLMQRMEADGRHWRNAYAEGFRDGQVSALRGFADTTRFPSHWVLFRRPDGSGVTVSDLLRETAARLTRGEGS